jgi:hypothetical protein
MKTSMIPITRLRLPDLTLTGIAGVRKAFLAQIRNLPSQAICVFT